MNTQPGKKRALSRVQHSERVTDGDGVRIQRNVAHKALETFDPFLLLDEIASDEAADYIGGFPEHPHRGFETVTYMLEGTMRHRDHMGNEGLLESGGVQWMTAGRGVIHSEMPQQKSGRLHGFQLWINLPAAEKMKPPGYQEFSPDEIPVIDLGQGGHIKVIAGSVTDRGEIIAGPVKGVSTEPAFFDISLPAGARLDLPVDTEKQVLLYAYQGHITVNGDQTSQALQAQELGLLDDGDAIDIRADKDSRFLLLAGKPLGEPIANWGPFVMNTPQQIEQAIHDYRNGNLVQA